MSQSPVDNPRFPTLRRTFTFLSNTAIMLLMLPLVAVVLVAIYVVAAVGEFALQVAAWKAQRSKTRVPSNTSDINTKEQSHGSS